MTKDLVLTTLIQLRFQCKTAPMDVRLGALKLYRRHLVEQYSDRCAWWALRDVSGDQMSRTMTIITDGADQDFRLCFLYVVSLSFIGNVQFQLTILYRKSLHV